jgi:hypothetical protein
MPTGGPPGGGVELPVPGLPPPRRCANVGPRFGTGTAKGATRGFMPALNLTLMQSIARSKFQSEVLRAGANRNDYFNYLDAVCSALAQAFEIWRSSASLTGVVINGPIATGGKLSGPALEGLIRNFAPGGSWAPYSRAIATGVHNQMRSFEKSAAVPALPLFPAFAAMPTWSAPPMRSVPTALMSICSTAQVQLEPARLYSGILAKAPKPKPTSFDHVATAVAEALGGTVRIWLRTTMVVALNGSGAVPNFAPPYVPVAPVLNGRADMPPGGLI